MTITAGSAVAAGSYTLAIVATDSGGALQQSASVTLVVNGPAGSFTLGATPGSQTVTQGQGTSFSATVTPQNGYSGSGSYSVTGLPAGAKAPRSGSATFKDLDKNKDGYIPRYEARDIPYDKFSKIDKDGDGKLSPSEHAGTSRAREGATKPEAPAQKQ